MRRPPKNGDFCYNRQMDKRIFRSVKKSNLKRLAAAVFFAALLSACGGGGGGTPLDISEREQLRAMVQNIRVSASGAAGLRQPELQAFLGEIMRLENNINGLPLNELRQRVRELESELALLPCEAGRGRIGGACVLTKICEYNLSRGEGVAREQFSEVIPAGEDCEYYANWGVNAINARYAYTRGYFGQGVTVFTDEQSHEPAHAELMLNAITGTGDNVGSIQNSHGTAMHGIIAAAQDGNGMHGVAPRAKVVLASFDNNIGGIFVDAVGALIPIPITNYIGTAHGKRIKIILANIPLLWGDEERERAADFAAMWGDSDTTYVHAAGNFGINTVNGTGRPVDLFRQGECGQNKESDQNCSNIINPLLSINEINSFNDLTSFVDERHGAFATMTISPFTTPNGIFPILYPELRDNFIVVADLARNLTIYNLSAQCGSAKNWCVGAPGRDTLAPYGDSNAYRRFGGTSGASAHVGGALAVLKSAARELPMTIIQPILLSTATDLGKPGIDEVYGRGIVNISAAIVQIENMKTARTSQFAPVSYFALRGALPAQFSHLHKHLQNAQIAVEVFDGMYYNMPLSRMFSAAAENTAPEMGEAAAKMLSEIPESKAAKGFFAFGASQNEFGVRWRGKTGGLRFFRGFQELGFLPNGADIMAEMSHAAADGAFSGAHLGALGAASGSSNGGKIRLGGNIKGNLSAFGEYEYRDISGRLSGGVLQTEIKGAESSGWTAGMEYADIGVVGSRLRLSASRRAELSGGEIVLHYPKAAGDNFREVFFGEGKQEIKAAATAIPLARRAPLLWTIGYAVEADSGGEWSAALEYDTGSKKSALSAKWRLEF